MSEDDKKLGESKDEAVTRDAHDETKVEVTVNKRDTTADQSDAQPKKDDEIDITAALRADQEKSLDDDAAKADDTSAPKDDTDDDDELQSQPTELDKELERVEGIESAHNKPTASAATSTSSPKESEVTKDDDDALASKPVDLETAAPASKEDAKNAVLMNAVQQHSDESTQTTKKKPRLGMLVALLLVLCVAAGAAAVYFYMQVQDTNDKLAGTESQLSGSQAQIAALKAQNAKDEAAAEATAADADYRTIPEIGVRFKETDATADLIYGYTVTSSDESADAVAFSTKPLARITVKNGASATYPCAFTGNVPTITRYADDVAVGDSTASKVGKQIGTAYYVYTAPTGQCAPSETEAQAARDEAVKAIYDGLEALPAEADDAATELAN